MGIINTFKHLVNSRRKIEKEKTHGVGESKGPQPKQFQRRIKQTQEENQTKSTGVESSSIVKDWERQVQLVKQHPLSQIKIINQTLLETLTDVLKSIDSKLENLTKIDEVIDLLKSKETELKKEGVETKEISKAIIKLENITFKDKQVLETLEREKKLSAEQMANVLHITRSTASLRLNRLYELGILNKEATGRNILFKLKKED